MLSFLYSPTLTSIHDYQKNHRYDSAQFTSVSQSGLHLCHRMDCSMWGIAVHHQLLEFFKLMSIELVMPSNHLILCHPLLLLHSVFPSIRSSPMSRFFASSDLSIEASALASIPPMNHFSSVAQSCLILCDPMDRSIPGFPVYHQLLELIQTHVHRVHDANQLSHLLSSFSSSHQLSQHQGLFQ